METNFSFLQAFPTLFKQVQFAERYFSEEPNTSMYKLRQFGEFLAKQIAVRFRLALPENITQNDRLKALKECRLDREILSMFHFLKNAGNEAVHEGIEDNQKVITAMIAAWQLSIWFVRTFGDNMANFEPVPFCPDYLQAVRNNENLAKYTENPTASQQEEQQLVEANQAEIQAISTALSNQSEEEKQAFDVAREKRAAQAFERLKNYELRLLDEKQTRLLMIDPMLREAGWEADSENLDYRKGVRPEKGRYLAIAEYPVGKDRADYVLFCELVPVAIVEAKKANVNVAGKVAQAERYAKQFEITENLTAPWVLAKRTVAWASDESANDCLHFYVPFVYSCNGKPYLKQQLELSGTWFRDVRQPSNLKRALQQFHTPDVLLEMLKKDEEQATQKLENEPFDFLGLRPYQEKAIQAVEQNLSEGKREMLLAMATGTGKTRTITGLIHRFLKTDRFRRILFLVDRTALAEQAEDTFGGMNVEPNQTLNTLYNFAVNGVVEPETKVKVATVQSLVKQIFYSGEAPAIDQFDCIIVDEAHRGYTLDQEMTDGELEFQDNEQYLSTYRRVLDYFDAVKIGLTATPALHTKEIFGEPVFVYSYKEAVIDDYLVDHEPPIEIKTKLNQGGIHFERGEQLEFIDTGTGEVVLSELADEQNFDVESFNRTVLNDSFNQVVCEVLLDYLDPFGSEKTLIFCATDLHADKIKGILDTLFKQKYGDEYNTNAVAKITGQADKPNTLIKYFKNERYPNIAITVDLLSTGIDVPEICNLVFLRRVKSRVLYEQMKGRATRKCEALGKTVFHIYDAVGLCRAMASVDTMKPIVKNVHQPISQLVEELQAVGKIENNANPLANEHQQALLEQISQKIMRLLRKADKMAEKSPQVKENLAILEQEWGVKPNLLHKHLLKIGVQGAVQFFEKHRNILTEFNRLQAMLPSERMPVISTHEDEVREITPIYGKGESADDYLQEFMVYIQQHSNDSVAIQVIINRPRNLTRQQLKEIELALDAQGFSKAKLNKAMGQKTNRQITAGIVAHIRRAAIGDSLVPFEQRVDHAIEKLCQTHSFKPNQQKWLERIAKQLKQNHDEILDRSRLTELFQGQFSGIRAEFGETLDELLAELNEGLWDKTG